MKKRVIRVSTETDHSPEWCLSKELIKINKRLRILCGAMIALWLTTLIALILVL